MNSKKIVLITGSSGFIGTEVVNKLKKNRKIILYLLINKNKKKKFKKSKNIKYIYCSLLNSYKLKKILDKLNITDVIHCAWSGVSGKVRNSPKQNINLKITDNLLNAIRFKKIKCFIALGSQAEYGSKFYKIHENSELRPRTKYGKIKIKILKKIRVFCTKNNIRFVWLRIFTGYGPNSENNWIIPSTIFKLINNQKTKFTSGNQIYNFIYVSDIASAIKKCLLNVHAKGIFNLGSQKSYTIKYVIKLIFKKLKIKNKPLFGELSYRNDQIMKFLPSILKIKKNLKWQPQYSISKGLNKTIKFIKKNNIV
jgi:nucleoside-diphosphate-sugar epimerase